MAQSPKRITRKDLRRPDQFVTLTGHVLDFLRAHRQGSVIAVAGIVAAFLLIGTWNLYKARQIRRAAQGYAQGFKLFQEQKYHDALALFDELSKSAPGSYRDLGFLYAGNTEIALGEPQKAITSLQRLSQRSSGRDYIRQLGLLSLGYAYEQVGDLEAAAKSFAAAEKQAGPFTEESLLGKARTNAQASNHQDALAAYKEYLASFAGSERAAEVALRVRELEAKLVGTGKVEGKK